MENPEVLFAGKQTNWTRGKVIAWIVFSIVVFCCCTIYVGIILRNFLGNPKSANDLFSEGDLAATRDKLFLSFKITYYLYSWTMRGLILKRSHKALGLVSSLVSFLLHAHENVSQFLACHLWLFNAPDNIQEDNYWQSQLVSKNACPKKYWSLVAG